MITGQRVRESVNAKFKNNGTLVKDIGSITSVAAAVLDSTVLGGVGAMLTVVGAGLSASIRTLELFEDPSPQSTVPVTSYERFRLVFYVQCQKSYFEAVEHRLREFDSSGSASTNVELDAQTVDEFKRKVASIDDAEIRFHYSVDPTDESIPLYDAYTSWLGLALSRLGHDGYAARALAHNVASDARARLKVAIAADTTNAAWMRGYLALAQSEQAARDLSAVRSILQGWTDPAAAMNAGREAAWSSYRRMLQSLPDEAGTMYAESFGVRRVFVPPRVSYHRACLSGKQDETDVVPHVGRLLGALVSNRPSADDLVVLCGGPGSGKSTLCRILASELASDPTVHPVFIRLRRAKEGAELSSFIEDHMTKEGLIHRLSDLRDIPNLVLILDGFDELVMASKARLRHFFAVLLEDLATGPLRSARAIVSGRDTLFPRGQGLPRGSHVVNLLPFDCEQVARWGELWRQIDEGASSFFPEQFVDDVEKKSPLHHLVTWPLSLHLVARSHGSGSLNFGSSGGELKKAYLYRQIMKDTAQRQSDQTHGTGRLSPAEMRSFLRAIAWEMYSRGVDSLEPLDVVPILQPFAPGATDLTELADVAVVNCPELHKGEDTGFEFVHKSFSEYLVAERVAGIVADVTQRVPRLSDDRLDWRYSEFDASRQCAQVLGVRLLTAEVQEMLEPMLGAWPQFARGDDYQAICGSAEYTQALINGVERFEALYATAATGEAVGTLLGDEQLHRSLVRSYANYAVGLVILGAACARYLSNLSDIKRWFHAEAHPGLYWRWLSTLGAGGLVLDETLAARVLSGVSVEKAEPPPVGDGGSPVPLRFVAMATGYRSEASDTVRETIEELLELVRKSLAAATLLLFEAGVKSSDATTRRASERVGGANYDLVHKLVIDAEHALRRTVANAEHLTEVVGAGLNEQPRNAAKIEHALEEIHSAVHSWDAASPETDVQARLFALAVDGVPPGAGVIRPRRTHRARRVRVVDDGD